MSPALKPSDVGDDEDQIAAVQSSAAVSAAGCV